MEGKLLVLQVEEGREGEIAQQRQTPLVPEKAARSEGLGLVYLAMFKKTNIVRGSYPRLGGNFCKELKTNEMFEFEGLRKKGDPKKLPTNRECI